MYKVFNMGHRMELYVPQEITDSIAISNSFNVEAKVIGRVEAHEGKKLTIKSPFGGIYILNVRSVDTIKNRFDEVSELIVDTLIISDMKQYIQQQKVQMYSLLLKLITNIKIYCPTLRMQKKC